MEVKAKAEEAQAGGSDRIVTESALLVAKEAEEEAAGPTRALVNPTEAKASPPETTQAEIQVETRATVEDKTTRVTAGDNSVYLRSKKPRPIAWPGLFVCCL